MPSQRGLLHDSHTSPDQRYAAFRHRSFLSYWAARFLTTFATMIVSVAVGWQMYDLTRDPARSRHWSASSSSCRRCCWCIADLGSDQDVQLVAGLDLGRAGGGSPRRRGRSRSRSPRGAGADPAPGGRRSPRPRRPGRRTPRRRARRSCRSPTSGRGSAGSSLVTPSRRASGSKLAPWIRVEVTTTKKMMLKISALLDQALDHRERREPDRDRAAQPGPAEHQPLAQREAVGQARDRSGQRTRDEDQHGRDQQPVARDVDQLAREDQQARAGRRARSARPSRGPGGRRRSCACPAPGRCPGTARSGRRRGSPTRRRPR